jgi:hypothetical protein
MKRHLTSVHKLSDDEARQWPYRPEMGGKYKRPVSSFIFTFVKVEKGITAMALKTERKRRVLYCY